jgi:hypothetical protein
LIAVLIVFAALLIHLATRVTAGPSASERKRPWHGVRKPLERLEARWKEYELDKQSEVGAG